VSDTAACPSCGAENPPLAKFCNECGARCAAPPAAVEERKVVTTLFCDLVGFTAMSEGADPEDVDRLLGEYFACATRAIESHGGSVEKFIGDAVVGVFGVPAAHEDDPERAVRAALRLLEALEGLSRSNGTRLEARCGVNTGEALVRLDVEPASGRGFLTGDAVNTAARLQAAAPPGGVVAGALTRELTRRAIVYEALPPVTAKGKAEPVEAWRALAPIARRGLDTGAAGLTPFVGREVELAYLTALFDKAVAQASPQFILLVGEPGIGKSRLVRQLLDYVDSRPLMTTWRQGYCPPFGEDVTYWALAEVVKAHAGIQDTDEAAAVEAKLDAVLPAGADREWFRQRLRALLGLTAAEASREENFTAWLRFFEELAASRPTVLVLEDLHWADGALLAFVEHLASHLASVPLLVVATARPELFERQPDFAAGGRINRVGMEPLTRQETARLVGALLGAADASVPLVERVVDTCDGNPFYAEQSARLLTDVAVQVSLPDSVQAVIAARLDALPPEQKALLADAAVVGGVFWDGALLAQAEREAQDLEQQLSGLLERRLIRRIRQSSMEGEREYVFAHALAREVAYGQQTRGARARKHAAVADWLEEKAGPAAEDSSSILTYHCMTALDLARAAGEEELVAELTAPAVRRVTLAGERALRLDVEAARRYFEWGLAAASELEAERVALLQGLGEAANHVGDPHRACELFREAATAAGRCGDAAGEALAKSWHAAVLDELCLPGGLELLREASALVAAAPPGRVTLEVLTLELWMRWCREETPEGVAEAVARVVALARELGEPPPVLAMGDACMARLEMGDLSALQDYAGLFALACEHGLGRESAGLLGNLGVLKVSVEGPAEAARALVEAQEFAVKRGLLKQAAMDRSCLFETRFLAGEWDAALELLEEVSPLMDASSEVWNLSQTKMQATFLLVARGQVSAAREHVEWVAAKAADSPMEWVRTNLLAAEADLQFGSGERDLALDTLRRWSARRVWTTDASVSVFALTAVRTALALDDVGLARHIATSRDASLPLNLLVSRGMGARLKEADADLSAAAEAFARAAAGLHDFGVPYEEGHALLGQGRCLVALGRAPEAAAPLAAAREIFARLGARPALAETDEWLAKAGEHRQRE
jgi:class 3 adenylate cyclase